jgi:sec-independent protein translocase protein TatB
MDNIGFTELLLLGIVALLVLGPEKLPGAIRTASLWIGRLKRSFNSIKTDIEREIGADEIRRQLRNEAIMDKFKQTKAQVNDAVNTVKKQTDDIRKNLELESQAAAGLLKPTTAAKPAASLNDKAALEADQASATASTAAMQPKADTPQPGSQTALPLDGDKAP